MYRDTDGYIIIDLKGIDVSRASQSVPGLYEKVAPVLDANKLVIVNNAGNHTPLPGSCIKASNYIRITTDIYIFTINSNNILIIEANGSSITVDVSIIPAYSEGTKIADFEINGQSGELYIPAYPDIINDSVASDHTVYSSDKVNTLLSGKADTSAIPTKTSELDNDSGYITSSDIPAIPDDLNDLSDVDISSVSDAQVLTYDAISGKWVNATSPTGVTALSQLSDVTIASASVGNVLTYDSTSGKWVNEAPSGVTTLSGLSDVELTTPASGNVLSYDGSEWVNDTLGAADIPYSSGVSVADKLDNVPTFDTLTTSDNNKLLCVIVSGDDIGVGAVDSQGAFEYQTKTLTYNGVDFVFTRRGHVCSVSVNHNSQVAYSTQWTSIGSLSSTYFNTGTQLIGMVIPGGNTLMFRLAYNGDVDIMCNANTNIWAQGTAVYLV